MKELSQSWVAPRAGILTFHGEFLHRPALAPGTVGGQRVALDAAARADTAAEHIVGVQVVSTLEGRSGGSGLGVLPVLTLCHFRWFLLVRWLLPTATLALPLPSLSLPPSFSQPLTCPSFFSSIYLFPHLCPRFLFHLPPCPSSHLTPRSVLGLPVFCASLSLFPSVSVSL